MNADNKFTREDFIHALKQTITDLMVRAETGEDWAEVCRLEAVYVALTGKQVM